MFELYNHLFKREVLLCNVYRFSIWLVIVYRFYPACKWLKPFALVVLNEKIQFAEISTRGFCPKCRKLTQI